MKVKKKNERERFNEQAAIIIINFSDNTLANNQTSQFMKEA